MIFHHTQSIMGKHAIIDLSGCDSDIMRDRESILERLKQAAQIAKVTVVGHFEHYFSPEGYSAVLVLEESHLSIHTWPEYRYISLDLYSCNLETDFDAVEQFLAQEFKATTVESQLLKRKFSPTPVSAPVSLVQRLMGRRC
ncbi:MAG: adenosylmethionine decarboxylase [Anaerolineae bacterium]|nr:adenosylmethionine decarboxylase [Anaerolineae bacterium]